MNSLLKRQIRKCLPKDILENEELKLFIDSVEKSYINYEHQYNRLQHAMSISSQELFEANDKLKSESKFQHDIILKLKNILGSLDPNYLEDNGSVMDSEGFKLIDFVDDQAKNIIKINLQRQKLLFELREQNQSLNDYAHMLSHDLRSPLRNIETLSFWIEEDNKDIDDGTKENIKLIKKNIELMDSLIKGVLEYTTIGKSEEVKSEVDIQKVVEEVIKRKKSKYKFEYNLVNQFPKIFANNSRVHQLFRNLIDNGLKFNDKSAKTIEIGYKDMGSLHQFYVKDNGNGIEEKYFEKIFDSFQRLESNQDSSGIGLSIVRKIIVLCEGKIWVESKVGEGSTFYFNINKKNNGKA